MVTYNRHKDLEAAGNISYFPYNSTTSEEDRPDFSYGTEHIGP